MTSKTVTKEHAAMVERVANNLREQGLSVKITSNMPWISIDSEDGRNIFLQGSEAEEALDNVPSNVDPEDWLLDQYGWAVLERPC